MLGVAYCRDKLESFPLVRFIATKELSSKWDAIVSLRVRALYASGCSTWSDNNETASFLGDAPYQCKYFLGVLNRKRARGCLFSAQCFLRGDFSRVQGSVMALVFDSNGREEEQKRIVLVCLESKGFCCCRVELMLIDESEIK